MDTVGRPLARTLRRSWLLLVLATLTLAGTASAQPFVHPGGLHNQADLDRMRTQVATGALPAGWMQTNIGTVTGAAAGFANVSGGTFVVAGSGTIGGSGDSVNFVHRNVTGDATITVRLTSLGGTVQKSGIMSQNMHWQFVVP